MFCQTHNTTDATNWVYDWTLVLHTDTLKPLTYGKRLPKGWVPACPDCAAEMEAKIDREKLFDYGYLLPIVEDEAPRSTCLRMTRERNDEIDRARGLRV